MGSFSTGFSSGFDTAEATMSNELQTSAPDGVNVYAIIRNSISQVYQVTTNSLVTWSDASYSTYAYPLAEQGTSGFFQANMPTVLPPDTYSVEFFIGSGSESDLFNAGGTLLWSGSVDYIGTALTSLTYVKDYISLNVSTFDGYLTNRINAASVAVQSWCNRNLGLTTYTESYDGPSSTTLLLKQTPVVSVAQIILNQFDVNATTIPGQDVVINNNAGIISINPSSQYWPTWFGYDYEGAQQNISVTYTAGFATIPLDIQEAVAKIVFNQYLTRGQDVTMMQEKIGDYQYTRRQDAQRLITDDIAAGLTRYKEFVV